MIPNFEDFGIKKYKWQDIMLIILGNGMAGILVMLATFYAILHAWMNGVAEMLRFGDRMFYKVLTILENKENLMRFNRMICRIGGRRLHMVDITEHGTWLSTTGYTLTSIETCMKI